ncbi:MAG: hypothetical protein ACREAC_22820 [Blastocatellia bacterium]
MRGECRGRLHEINLRTLDEVARVSKKTAGFLTGNAPSESTPVYEEREDRLEQLLRQAAM